MPISTSKVLHVFIYLTFPFPPDLPPASAVCWEQYNWTGQHQKAQVSLSAPCDEVLAAWLLVCDCARVSSSLPMLTVLRKFTILMTMMLEVYVLRWATSDLTLLPAALKGFVWLHSYVLFSRKRFPKRLVYSVSVIVLGAMVAAWYGFFFFLF